MKNTAQIVSSMLIVGIITKSFFTQVSVVDAINLIALVVVYCMYEFLSEKKLKKDLDILRSEHSEKLENLQKDLNDTKNYMSKVSTSMAFRK